MADKSKIEWCDATVNPIRARRKDNGKVGTHCEKVSPACKNCYAERRNLRNLPFGTGLPYTAVVASDVDIFCEDRVLEEVIRWKRGRRIFWCSMTDLFADFVPDELIDRCFAAMALSPRHTHLVLTKRAKRMHEWMTGRAGRYNETAQIRVMKEAGERVSYWENCDEWNDMLDRQPWPLLNVWLGVTAENQQYADERIPWLLQTPAAKRFVSIEPMLGPVDVGPYLSDLDGALDVQMFAGLDWVITGGESGAGARPSHPDWLRSLRDQCAAANVPFLFKQWGEWAPFATEARYAKDSLMPGGDEVVGGDCGGPGSLSYSEPRRRIPHGKVVARWGSETAGVLAQVCNEPTHRWGKENLQTMTYVRVGKKRAGRLLDGREHNEFPTTVTKEVTA